MPEIKGWINVYVVTKNVVRISWAAVTIETNELSHLIWRWNSFLEHDDQWKRWKVAATMGAMTLPIEASSPQVFPAVSSPSWVSPRLQYFFLHFYKKNCHSFFQNFFFFIVWKKKTNICATSWAIMNALVSPSSRFKAQDLAGSQAPPTGAYPDGPPMSSLVNQTATS